MILALLSSIWELDAFPFHSMWSETVDLRSGLGSRINPQSGLLYQSEA